MKAKIFISISLIIIGFVSCEKAKDINIDSIVDTKWKLAHIVDTSGEISDFPSDINDFQIVFRKSGKIDLTSLCNYSFGSYTVTKDDSISIYNVGPGTLKYCLPNKAMDWESLFINSLRSAKTYLIIDRTLIINSQDYKLLFDFISIHDSDKGTVLFCTNAHMINCVFEIEISIDGEKAGTLDASSIYSGNDCYCENSAGIGLLISLDKGIYEYSAKMVKCSATNITNSWTGDLTVVGDSCSVVFLDITKD